MSKIEFEQISDDVVEIQLSAHTPMEMVQQLTKSLTARGLVEDVASSTLSVRYFYRPSDNANVLADKLIKSLEGLTKSDTSDLPHWHPKAQIAHRKKLKDNAIAERRAKLGMIPGPNAPPRAKTTPISFDNGWTAGGTGKRYANIKDPVLKIEEHEADCDCGHCEEIEKSNYGPKGAQQYSVADNARRKANNTGDKAGIGPNTNTKAYSTKPGQLSGKNQVDLTARIQNAANKKEPIKRWTPEMIAAENEKRGFKKSWGEHHPFPSAEEEIMKLAKNEPVDGETAAANQLMNLMAGKSMLGKAPPSQPTNEEMFGGGVVSEEMAKAAEHKWGNTFNNWMVEAAKPISQRFASEEEESAYWANIKVMDKDNGQSGY